MSSAQAKAEAMVEKALHAGFGAGDASTRALSPSTDGTRCWLPPSTAVAVVFAA